MNNRGLLGISISTQLVQAFMFWCSAAKGMHLSYPPPHPVGPQGKLKMNLACSDPWAKLTIPFAVIEPRLQRRKLCYTTLKLFVKRRPRAFHFRVTVRPSCVAIINSALHIVWLEDHSFTEAHQGLNAPPKKSVSAWSDRCTKYQSGNLGKDAR